MSRRHRLTLAAITATAMLALAGCAGSGTSTVPSGESADPASFPITVEHAFGETTIESADNVVTLGWGSTDAAIALGTVPVAMEAQAYGGDEDGVLPWVAEKLKELGAETPTVIPTSSETPPYDEIAEAAPDLILAVYSGITDEQYKLLSEIAPTVAYPVGVEAWATPWKDVVTSVGEALGKPDEADALLDDIAAEVTKRAEAHPELKGKTVAAVWDVGGTFYVYKSADPRVSFLFDLGLVSAPSVEALASGDETFYYTLSYEELDKLDADIIVSFTDTQEEADAFLTASYTQVIPAVQNGSVASIVGQQLVASVSPPTALSLTWGLDDYVDALAQAAAALG